MTQKKAKAWAVMYHDNPERVFQSFGTTRLLIYKSRSAAMSLKGVGPIVPVEITVLPKKVRKS